MQSERKVGWPSRLPSWKFLVRLNPFNLNFPLHIQNRDCKHLRSYGDNLLRSSPTFAVHGNWGAVLFCIKLLSTNWSLRREEMDTPLCWEGWSHPGGRRNQVEPLPSAVSPTAKKAESRVGPEWEKGQPSLQNRGCRSGH